MADASGTLETLVLQLGKLLQPLESLLGPDFFFSLGAELPRDITGDATLVSQLSAASSAAGALDSDITTLSSAIGSGNDGSIISAGAALIISIGKLISALENVGNALDQVANGLSATDKARLQAFAPTMAARTMEYMLVGYLTDELPSLATTIDVLGLIDREFTPSPALEVSRAPSTVTPRRFYFDRIAQLFSSPGDYFQQTYGWGSGTFDGSALLPKVQALFESLGIPAAIYTTAGQPPVLEAFIFNLQADKSTTPPGMKADVSLPGNVTFDQTIPFSTFWQGTLHVQANYAAGVGVTLRPPFNVNVFNGILTGNCSEITLPTGIDQHGEDRTAVCCLSSLNLENWFAWKDNGRFIEDVMRFLDNVLQDFIDRAPTEMVKAKYSAMRERSVGLGVMGFHSFLQSENVPWESVVAKSWNMRMFKHIRIRADAASLVLADERGRCPDAAEWGVMERFSHKMSIAPTASISIICGGSSPGIEPIAANVFLQKTLSGSHSVRNRHLKKLLAEKSQDTDAVWSSITLAKGSVQHLDFLTEHEKMVYRTAFELDQRWVIEHAADRTPFICQSQSVNVFLRPDVHKRDLHQIHFSAWKKGLKSLYHCRSMSIQRADNVSEQAARPSEITTAAPTDYSECLACQ